MTHAIHDLSLSKIQRSIGTLEKFQYDLYGFQKNQINYSVHNII